MYGYVRPVWPCMYGYECMAMYLVVKSNECAVIIPSACPNALHMEESFVAKIAKYEVLRDAVGHYYKEASAYITAQNYRDISINAN